ncbi:MAG: M1 family metallopeptidase [bacterium]
MKNIFLLFCFLTMMPGYLFSQKAKPTIPAPERIRTYDLNHIKINVKFNWELKQVIGNVETEIQPLADDFKDFEVDAVGFKINSVRDENNNDLNYEYDGKKIKIILNENISRETKFKYSVDYTCQPQRGLFFIYPTELNPSLPYQIWTQGESQDNSHWIPVYDYPNDKTTFEIYVTVDRKYKTLSNGSLEYSKKISGTEERQDHWVMNKPNSTYLIMLGVGEFEIIRDKADSLSVESYVDQNINIEDAKFTFRNTPQMVNVFNERFQYQYPWNKYAQVVVEDFTYGGMENTTATLLNKRVLYTSSIENDYSSDETISHELAHQWWGDLTTCRNWSEMWLNESFATFSAVLWKESYYNRDEYDYEILKSGDNAIAIDSSTGRFPIWSGFGTVTTNIYSKGSVILNSFRSILGEDFFPALSQFLKDNEYGIVETRDLIDAINKYYNSRHKTNADFKWMFDQWIWKAGYPEFEVSYFYDDNLKQVNLNVRQVQRTDTLTPVFRIPVNIRIKSLNEDKTKRVEILYNDETFEFHLSSIPEMIVFDQGNNILDKTYFDKPFADWKNQLEKSEMAIDRIMAVRGLENFLKQDTSWTAGKPPISINQLESLQLLEGSLNNDLFWGVRTEAAKVLAKNFIIDRTSSILKNSYDKQSDSRIKREILKALGNSGRTEDADFIKNIIQSETNDYIVADGISALGKSLPKEEIYDAVIKFAFRAAHRSVIQNAVVNALNSIDNKNDDNRIKKVLMDIAFGIDVDGRLRANALNSLKKYAKDEDVKTLAMKYADFNFMFVKRAIVGLLANSQDKSIINFLKNMKEKTTDEELGKLLLTSIKKIEDS